MKDKKFDAVEMKRKLQKKAEQRLSFFSKKEQLVYKVENAPKEKLAVRE